MQRCFKDLDEVGLKMGSPGCYKGTLSAWWLTYPSEQYLSMGRIIPYIMEKKNV
jgi:hypothetical protein